MVVLHNIYPVCDCVRVYMYLCGAKWDILLYVYVNARIYVHAHACACVRVPTNRPINRPTNAPPTRGWTPRRHSVALSLHRQLPQVDRQSPSVIGRQSNNRCRLIVSAA